MLSNLTLISNNRFEVEQLYLLKKYYVNNEKEIIAEEYSKVPNNVYWDIIYKDLIDLGKMLYDEYKDKLIKLDRDELPFLKLIKYKNDNSIKSVDDFNKEPKRIKIFEEWLKVERHVYLEDFNPDTNEKRVHVYYLTDIALFSYLVLTSLNNYYLDKDLKRKTNESKKKVYIEKKYKNIFSNDIYFDTFTTVKRDDINSFLKLITDYMYLYEIHDVKLLLVEHSRLSYEQDYNFVKSFHYVFGLYWFILKMYIYSITHSYKIINICGCGSLITSRADRCDNCKRLYDAYRKQIERHPEILKED